MKSNILYTVTSLNIIDKLKAKGIENFVFPLAFFCVGIPNTFTLNQINVENAYLYINRILDTKAIDEFKEVIKILPSNIKGIIFDDLGILNVIKDLEIEKILYLSHFNNNYRSVNAYLKYVDTIILSTDITEKEIDEIIYKADKKISLFTFGLVSSMYSRRLLNTNYQKHYNLKENKSIEIESTKKRFISIENDYGTVFYHFPYFNGTILNKKNVKYNFYFPLLLSDDLQIQVIDNNFANIESDDGFLHCETYFKLKERKL